VETYKENILELLQELQTKIEATKEALAKLDSAFRNLDEIIQEH